MEVYEGQSYHREFDGEEVSLVGYLPGVGVRIDFRTTGDDKEFEPRLGIGVIFETATKTEGEYLLETRLVLVAVEVLTDRVRYILTVEDELLDRDVVERSYWLEERDLVVPQLSGSSKIELGKGYWGMLAGGVVKEVGIDNLFELVGK
jgi:hypothetical protein